MSLRESRWFDGFCDWLELLSLLAVVAAMAIIARLGLGHLIHSIETSIPMRERESDSRTER